MSQESVRSKKKRERTNRLMLIFECLAGTKQKKTNRVIFSPHATVYSLFSFLFHAECLHLKINVDVKEIKSKGRKRKISQSD